MIDWNVHVGAHKTATTHLQDSLHLVRDDLALRGIAFVPRHIARDLLAAGIRESKSRIQMVAKARKCRTSFKREAGSASSIVISEENLLGGPRGALHMPLYPACWRGIKFIRYMTWPDRLHLFLSIRGFDAIVPGAYATDLRFKKITAEDKDIFIRRVKLSPPSWITVIELIKELAPNARLSIWRYEDYVKNKTHVTQKLINCDGVELPDVPAPKKTVTPSFSAVAKVEALLRSESVGGAAWTALVDSIYAENSALTPNDKFNFLDNELIGMLRHRYDLDCRTIVNRWPDSVLFL